MKLIVAKTGNIRTEVFIKDYTGRKEELNYLKNGKSG